MNGTDGSSDEGGSFADWLRGFGNLSLSTMAMGT
jgi:hypothetical protein